jgi:hypothetical protein
MEFEAGDNIMSFAEHVDSAAKVSMELCRQLAGANQPSFPVQVLTRFWERTMKKKGHGVTFRHNL